ncbi:hypothetical protein TSUD_19650 [Trifolium subterraneum]|uniref:RNase H type-1 domain-containing protein n=1 Tax=Trifolium subterraneum TaxID=3900 RepID=A0A2Z6NJ27_TRISU|nr:hypothetical protein TSUD_19650 [Trifolium subterraneum]
MSALMSFLERDIMNVGWQPLIGNYVKLNTNGASKENSIVGCGGIIRGNQCEYLGGFAKGVGVCTAFVAELFLYARSLGFTAVESNIDSIVVVSAIKNGRKSSSIGKSLVKQIRRSLELDWDIKIVHVYRESNKCVDALANIGCTLDCEVIHYDSFPNEIRNLVLDDERGITTPE